MTVVWCTGAGKGIGRAVVKRLVQDGASVAASARTRVDLESLAAETAGGARPYPLDVTDEAAVRDAARAIEADIGPLDLVILNAGTHTPLTARQFDVAAVRRIMETNFMGTVNPLAAVLPRFIERRHRRRGHIAVVASIAGYRGLPSASAYGASKSALITMCEALKPELDHYGVKLTLINPGFVKTPLTDLNTFEMPFLMDVDAAARRIVAGLKSNRFEVTFPKRFTWGLKIARCLPYSLYFALTRGIGERLIKSETDRSQT
ncbi:MAG: SDR family NAD(P)-dependent oxidoreductase [Rhodospirillales bacterium]|nr:SDR family NAD(P)-dependent oxidoreductase [Rhodospirillales bacterium]